MDHLMVLRVLSHGFHSASIACGAEVHVRALQAAVSPSRKSDPTAVAADLHIE
jgi:hypothetical protein